MTPHPADQARRALQEARERAAGRGAAGDAGLPKDDTASGAATEHEEVGEHEATAPADTGALGTGAVPAAETASGAEPAPETEPEPEPEKAREAQARPGDVAREALRRAIAARRGGTADTDDPGTDDAGSADDRPAVEAASGRASDSDVDAPALEASAAADGGTPGSSTREASAGAGPTSGAGTRSAAPEPQPASPAQAGGEADRRGGRPADVAREALRAARDTARRARADAVTQEAGTARRASRPRPPIASPARGATSGRSADRRARDVRELLADAFRMPDEEPGDSAAREGGIDSAGPPSPPTSPDDTATATDTGPDTPSTASPVPTTTPPAPPRRPSSMAAPDRDGDLRRTFPAFPPRPSDGTGFAETWWGNAWVTALEEGALDAKRLARGRTYAEHGNVDAITVTPGLVLAYVQGSRPRPYRVQVRLRTLDDADWDRFLDSAAERPGHIAALLDREMPQALAEGGVPLLPGPGDLEPQCSCPDRGHPCKHAAALCYQTARLLDADPFVLLLLRGRGERDLLDALSRLSATRAARAAQDQAPARLPGVRASEVLAPRSLPPLPTPLPPPPHPEQPPVYPAAPGGPDPFALDQLATDAAARAHALLVTGRDPVGELTLWQDAVRLAAARPGSGLTAGTRALYAALASAAGRTPAELARAVAAWRQGGPAGLAVLEEPWDPPAGRFDRARPLLLAADLPAFRPWHNHLTHPRGHVQLRLGLDGLWYAYESEPGHDDWWPRGTPDLDPVGALTGLGSGGEF
ncbi:SWIM zinc finger family protein [Streptomyces sp. AC555_RSS877]|uniref:SWIM zinc finger family protein n=1 Tax=Streptomyces sp. AC555_RSS877 TaxID=2823688 RepID=UPI0027E4CE05|nr:SWIM zinc finger family protein [Streptomyces sp. AC555_RSS877]